jgi:hypothetical protein
MKFKVGDVIAHKGTGKLYTITEPILYTNNFRMKSNSSGRIYDLTEHGMYDIFTSAPTQSTGCNHEWKSYNSGWVAYDFCIHCDVKKNNNDSGAMSW